MYRKNLFNAIFDLTKYSIAFILIYSTFHLALIDNKKKEMSLIILYFHFLIFLLIVKLENHDFTILLMPYLIQSKNTGTWKHYFLKQILK